MRKLDNLPNPDLTNKRNTTLWVVLGSVASIVVILFAGVFASFISARLGFDTPALDRLNIIDNVFLSSESEPTSPSGTR